MNEMDVAVKSMKRESIRVVNISMKDVQLTKFNQSFKRDVFLYPTTFEFRSKTNKPCECGKKTPTLNISRI
mgnify:CR=1 FL=1